MIWGLAIITMASGRIASRFTSAFLHARASIFAREMQSEAAARGMQATCCAPRVLSYHLPKRQRGQVASPTSMVGATGT
jgi:hypothetical protein